MVNWFANQTIYGTTQSRRTTPQSDHRGPARRDPQARHRRGVDPAHRRRGRSACGSRPPLLRLEGRPADRDRRSDRRGSADAAPSRARRSRPRARSRARPRLSLHRVPRRPRPEHLVHGNRGGSPPPPSVAQAFGSFERGDRGRAHRPTRPSARLSEPSRRQRRSRLDAHLPAVRGRRDLATRSRCDQPAPAPPHGGGAGRQLPRSQQWKD
jgi:hypothetical protein